MRFLTAHRMLPGFFARPLWLTSWVLALSCCTPKTPSDSASQRCNSQSPCPLNCQDSCFNQAASMASACMITLEGQFNGARTACSFADGSSVTFARPVPLQQDELTGHPWHLTILRQGQTCLELESAPLDWSQPVGRGQTIITTTRGTYSQELWKSPLLTDGGAVVVNSREDQSPGARLPDGGPRDGAVDTNFSEGLQLVLGCADGTYYELKDPDCQPLPEAQVLGVVGSSFSLSLSIGPLVTPLFSCQ